MSLRSRSACSAAACSSPACSATASSTRLKPAPRHLTRFYLMISVGGAVGAVARRHPRAAGAARLLRARGGHRRLCAAPSVAGAARPAGVRSTRARRRGGERRLRDLGRDRVLRHRDLGVAQLLRRAAGPGTRCRRDRCAGRWSTARSCTARSTSRRNCSCARRPTTPRRPASAACCETLHPRLDPIRVGVIGLGTGTLAVYGSRGDVYRFYEINPDVLEAAQRDFTFLSGQRRDHRVDAGRRAARAGARAAAELRRAGGRRLLQRRDSRAPHHLRGGRHLQAPPEAGRRHRLPRHQPLPEPDSGRRGAGSRRMASP